MARKGRFPAWLPFTRLLACAEGGSYDRPRTLPGARPRPHLFGIFLVARIQLTALAIGLLALGACAKDNQFDETGGVRITRSACPALAVPAYTGDVTLFDPPASRAASAGQAERVILTPPVSSN
jgi:hypothetical protein